MAPGEGAPLSLRPFPVTDKKPKNIADFVARVNAQAGGFRELNVAKLQEEIAATEANNSVEVEDADMSEDEDEEDEEDKGEPEPDSAKVRQEILTSLETAGNTAMLTLDTLSLLLSKHNPSQASSTLSKSLRDMVGIGTLGADKLNDPRVPEKRRQEMETISLGWTLKEIDKTRKSAENAFSFLEKEIEAEGKYWEEIISVQKKGWAMCKMPLEPSTLGVRFGFSEAAPEFKKNGLAPMRRGDDGVVQLDSGRLGGVSERVLVTYEKDGQVVGRSSLPAQTDMNAPLETRVLEARNTLYSQELWHELGREARTLLAYDVRHEDSKIRWDIDSNSSVTIELVALGAAPSPAETLPADNLAEMISLTLHLLLSHAHRQSEYSRTRPMPPHVPRTRGQQHLYVLLRPIIARAAYMKSVKACVRHVGSLTQTLRNAGLDSSFHLSTRSIVTSEATTTGISQPAGAQQMLHQLLQPADSSISLKILPEASLTIRGRTLLFPFTATFYMVQLPPSSPLATICPPHREYPDVEALGDYINMAAARLLTSHYFKIHQPTTTATDKSTKLIWTLSLDAAAIQAPEADIPSLSFTLDAETLCVGHVAAHAHTRKPETKFWKWKPSKADSEDRALDDVVSEALSQV